MAAAGVSAAAATLSARLGAASGAGLRRDSLPCEIRIVTDRSGFDGLEADWTALFARAGRPDQLFQSFNWLWHWSNHFLDGTRALSIVTGWSAGRLVMVWPLVRRRRFGVTIVSWMGEPASQYGDVLVEPGPLAAAMIRQGLTSLLAAGFDVAVLRKTRRTSPLSALLAETGLSTGSDQAPYLNLAGAKSFAEVEKVFSPKERSSRRRLMRRLEEAGPVDLVEDASGEAARDLVRSAFVFKTQGLEQRGRYSPALGDPAMLAFFVEAMTSVERPVGAMINAVLCGGRTVGVALSLTCKGEGFGHILAHDTGFERQGVGVILAEQIFRSAHRRGLARFDMLAPAEEFKLKWASGAVGLDDWSIPLTTRGALFVHLWIGRLRPSLKRFLLAASPRLAPAIWPAFRLIQRLRRR